MIRADLKAWLREFGASLDIATLEDLFSRWAPVFGVKHALIVLTGFRENVKRHDMERRELKPDEGPENVVLQFNPRDHRDMLVPCLWDRWEQGGLVLNSFALITDDPPSEVAAAGHMQTKSPSSTATA